MRYCLLLLIGLLSLPTVAQQGADYLDVIKVRGGKNREGTIVSYTFQGEVTIRDTEGTLTTLRADQIRRIEYRKIAEAPLKSTAEASPKNAPQGLPDRKWRHQLSTTVDFARENQVIDFGGGFFESSTTTNLGLGVNYHFVCESAHLSYGIGPGLNVLTARRSESVVTLTGLMEYALGDRRLRPTFRVEGGYAHPIGTAAQSISNRRGGALLFPSLGLALRPETGRWGGLHLQLGYRFTNVGFTLVTPNLEIIDRRVDYRRLVLSIGSRF